MELIAELNPPRDPVRLNEMAAAYSRVFDWIDVPDAPLGKPNYSSPVVSAYLAARGYNVIAHLRVADVNTIALKTITKTMGSLGVKRIVYLRGDPPQQGSTVNDYTPEEAVRYARSRPEAPEPGLLLSLKRSREEITARLAAPAGFYFILNLDWAGHSNMGLLGELSREARGMGKKLYAYLHLAAPHCRSPEEAVGLVERVADLVDGVLLSEPSSPLCIESAGRSIRGALG